jgi:type IV secretory pathway TraG/TraD family ATPase VirD4
MRPHFASRHPAARIEMGTPIGTAQWADRALVEETYYYQEGDVWLGRSPTDTQLPIGYQDDRHVCLVSGSRAGKGTSTIITNLCLWPGSVVVVDPKGENATVTAPRRGKGSPNCEGLGQSVHVLDPFNSAQVDDAYRSRLNPLDAMDPHNEETIDEAARLADAIVVVHEQAKDPFWDESARTMVKGLILHILTAPEYEGRRNLITLRQLITRGDWEAVEALRQSGETEISPAHALLWMEVGKNPAYGGIVAGLGDTFTNMLVNSPKQFESVLQVANRNTEFIDSPAMQRCLEASDFDLAALKTDPKGMSLYLCLPQRFMNTHYRWLRLMISLTVTEMEIVRGRPATGHPVMIMLDEFAGLKRMEIIEHAVAQIAGYGVKLFFVLQSLEQLKAVYQDNWETFLSNSGLKVFFSLDDHFSRDYVSKLVGETEVVREVRSASESQSESESSSHTISHSRTKGRSVTDGTNWSETDTKSRGINSSRTRSRGRTFGSSWVPTGFLGLGEKILQYSRNRNRSKSRTEGTSRGWSHSRTRGGSHSETESESYTEGESFGTTHGTSHSHTTGASETIHRRSLVNPDEIGHMFARISDPQQSAYPGLALVVISGERAITLRRVNYFEDYEFARRFEPHPDFPSPPHWKELTVSRRGFGPYDQYLAVAGLPESEIEGWLVKPGQIVAAGDPVLGVNYQPSRVNVRSPYTGMITKLPGAEKAPWLFSLRYRESGEREVNPFEDFSAFAKEFTARTRTKLRKARRSAWVAAVLGLLFVIALSGMGTLWWLAAIGLAGIWVARKVAQIRKCKRILAARPKDLLEDGTSLAAWKIPEGGSLEAKAEQVALPPAQPAPAEMPAAINPVRPESDAGTAKAADLPASPAGKTGAPLRSLSWLKAVLPGRWMPMLRVSTLKRALAGVTGSARPGTPLAGAETKKTTTRRVLRWVAWSVAGVVVAVVVVMVAGVIIAWWKRPGALDPGLYQCEAGNQASCRIYRDANGVLHLDERPYTQSDPLFGTLRVDGDEATFVGEAGTGRCGEEARAMRIPVVRIGSIQPWSAHVIVPEALKACDEERDTARLKHDAFSWHGTLNFHAVGIKAEKLPDGKERVVGYDIAPESVDFTIDFKQ